MKDDQLDDDGRPAENARIGVSDIGNRLRYAAARSRDFERSDDGADDDTDQKPADRNDQRVAQADQYDLVVFVFNKIPKKYFPVYSSGDSLPVSRFNG